MKACPRCKSVSRQRTRRKGFFRLMPGLKQYNCDKCNKPYIWFSSINWSLRV